MIDELDTAAAATWYRRNPILTADGDTLRRIRDQLRWVLDACNVGPGEPGVMHEKNALAFAPLTLGGHLYLACTGGTNSGPLPAGVTVHALTGSRLFGTGTPPVTMRSPEDAVP